MFTLKRLCKGKLAFFFCLLGDLRNIADSRWVYYIPKVILLMRHSIYIQLLFSLFTSRLDI